MKMMKTLLLSFFLFYSLPQIIFAADNVDNLFKLIEKEIEEGNHLNKIKTLLESGADVNIFNIETKETPLCMTIRHYQNEKKLDLKDDKSFNKNRRIEQIVKLLISREDIDVNSHVNSNKTNLLEAAIANSTKIMRMLLNHPKMNELNSRGRGKNDLPIEYACLEHQVEIAELLLGRDDLEIPTYIHPLAFAFANLDKKLFLLFLENKNVINIIEDGLLESAIDIHCNLVSLDHKTVDSFFSDESYLGKSKDVEDFKRFLESQENITTKGKLETSKILGKRKRTNN